MKVQKDEWQGPYFEEFSIFSYTLAQVTTKKRPARYFGILC